VPDLPRARGGRLDGCRVALLLESDFYEPEVFYYERRFAEEGADLRVLSRLWGMDSITFTGHEYRVPYTVTESLEDLDDDALRELDALIVPSGMVADRLRYTEDVNRVAPAVELLRRAFAEPTILKGVICHGMWLAAPVPEVIRGRKIVVHNNLIGDARNMGAEYVDADVVVDGDDLVTARTGEHAHLFAAELIERIARRRAWLESASGSHPEPGTESGGTLPPLSEGGARWMSGT
jgi:protease I